MRHRYSAAIVVALCLVAWATRTMEPLGAAMGVVLAVLVNHGDPALPEHARHPGW